MAQIIQHKRGTLEDLSGISSANVGELLVVTGSSISALAEGLVFVGNSSSQITSVNRILTGSSTPDLTTSDYDEKVDGIPFYNTSTQKLEILANAGNTNVVFTKDSLNLDGTGIVSSSAQVSSLAGTSDARITLTPGAGIGTIGDFTLNQSSAETITIGVDGVLEDLDTLGAASTDGQFIVATGAGTFAYESGATVRTSLGVDAAGTDNSGVTVTASSVAKGGTTFNKLALGTTAGTALAGDTALLQLGSTSSTALAGDTALLQLGSTSSTALAGDTAIDNVSVANLRSALTGISDSTTIGDATDVTITTSGDLTVTGDLIVNGDTVQTNVTTMNVEDNIINLNFGGSATNGGLYVGDVTGTTTSGSILWDGTNDYWIAGAKDSEARVIVQGASAGTSGTITKFDGAGTIVDSIITESGTTVTISNDLILNGLTASSFLHANSSKQLTSVSTSTDGDILVSDGAGAFSATNSIDGGTF